jgi:nicotinamidase-related amidase
MNRRFFIKGLLLSLLPTTIFANKKGENIMQKALILIDFQNDYFEGGVMELKNISKALENANILIQKAKKEKWKIYTIKHISTRKGAKFFLPNTKGVKLHKNLDIKDTKIITKHFPNSFRETELHNMLQKENIQNLIICGAMTHMCVDSTIRAGFDLGYNITLAQDACATKDLLFKNTIIKAKEVHNSFISALGGIFCQVKDTKDIIM